MKRSAEQFRRWAYTDGTTLYIARSEPEKYSGRRQALGGLVWRMADGSDGLYEDCVGPCSYTKAQGLPVRVWGMLANGVFSYAVLAEGGRMSG